MVSYIYCVCAALSDASIQLKIVKDRTEYEQKCSTELYKYINIYNFIYMHLHIHKHISKLCIHNNFYIVNRMVQIPVQITNQNFILNNGSSVFYLEQFME